jgi:hypothetical protein
MESIDSEPPRGGPTAGPPLRPGAYASLDAERGEATRAGGALPGSLQAR